MQVRAYTDADFEAVRAMHVAQGFGYALPELRDPLFLVRSVVEQGGRPRMATILRLTAEAYLLADPCEGSPRERWRWLLALHEAVRQEAAARGLADVQAFLPPRVARAFGRRLAALGWRRDPWTCYTRVLAPVLAAPFAGSGQAGTRGDAGLKQQVPSNLQKANVGHT
jgi:hypothetical protein